MGTQKRATGGNPGEMNITLEELMSEADAMRPGTIPYDRLTRDQKAFLKHCKTGQRVLSFTQIATLWNKAGWTRTEAGTLQYYVQRMRDNGEL